jgi:hypothetical protein
MYKQQQGLYVFGPFRLDPLKRPLVRNVEQVPVTPKAFDTLLALVEQNGKTIEKGDLMNGDLARCGRGREQFQPKHNWAAQVVGRQQAGVPVHRDDSRARLSVCG